jgi:lantibiotic biosynthesis protein
VLRGQVLFLYKAADFFKDAGFSAVANNICKVSAERTSFGSTLLEAGQVCHGTAGVSHFYRVLGELSGLECCATAASFWIEQTINNIDKDLDAGTNGNCLNMIEGLPGIGLVLMSYLSAKKLDWGSLILLE